MFSDKFIAASADYCTLTDHIAAPLLRKSFQIQKSVSSAHLTVCGLGFYRAFLNGREITKGFMAPYIANPDALLYYDRYDISELLRSGANAVGFLLGNGILNAMGGAVWKLDTAAYRSAPKVAFSLEITYTDGTSEQLEASDQVKVHPSPILFDDQRCGEIYDARGEIPEWNTPEFDDSGWECAIPAVTPKGTPTLCAAEPIVMQKALSPVSVKPARIGDARPATKSPIWYAIPFEEEDRQGYLYDFGENLAGILRLRIRGHKGQRISVQAGEILDREGNLNLSGMRFQPEGMQQRLIYTCSGNGLEQYAPSFTYFGMRYCLVSGITPEQATEDLLTFEVMSSDLKRAGNFSCSDSVINQLMRSSLNADISNFYYFPTDCPQREKNGWTGDAAISAEQLLLWFRPDNSLRVWMDNIRKAQRESGELPGIVPTAGWGFSSKESISYNGPAWDRVITELPYYAWKLRGNTRLIQENTQTICKYLDYLSAMRGPQGLLNIGLWDYVPIRFKQPMVPVIVSDTLIAMDICKKCALLFGAIGNTEAQTRAQELFFQLRTAARTVLLEPDGVTVLGRCQSAQALGIAYGLFDPGERKGAVDTLLAFIRKSGNHLDTGILGERVLFDVLADYGHAELAYHMITRPEYPSFGHWILSEECTSMFESFKTPQEPPCSKNHHWHGHITAWFFKYLAGIRINPHDRDIHEIDISPNFISTLEHAEAHHMLPYGKVSAAWKRTGSNIVLAVTLPEGCYGMLRLPEGWVLPCENYSYAAHTLAPGSTEYLLYPN